MSRDLYIIFLYHLANSLPIVKMVTLGASQLSKYEIYILNTPYEVGR